MLPCRVILSAREFATGICVYVLCARVCWVGCVRICIYVRMVLCILVPMVCMYRFMYPTSLYVCMVCVYVHGMYVCVCSQICILAQYICMNINIFSYIRLPGLANPHTRDIPLLIFSFVRHFYRSCFTVVHETRTLWWGECVTLNSCRNVDKCRLV